MPVKEEEEGVTAILFRDKQQKKVEA